MNISPINPTPSSFKPTPMFHTFVDENLIKLDDLKTDEYCPTCALEHPETEEPEILTPEEKETLIQLLAKAMHGMIASVRHDENGPIAQYLKAVTNPFETTEMVDIDPERDYLDSILNETQEPLVNYSKLFEGLDKYIDETPKPASYISDGVLLTDKKPSAIEEFDSIPTEEPMKAPPVQPM